MSQASKDAAIQAIPLFALPKRAAYGLTAALVKDNSDVPYKAMMSASKAALATCREYDRYKKRDLYCVIAFPIVVMDGRLFEYFFDGDANETSLEEIAAGTLVSRNPVVGEPHTIVTIATSGALPDIVETARTGAGAILNAMRQATSYLKRSSASSA